MRTTGRGAETVVAKTNKPTSVTSHPVQYPRCVQTANGVETVYQTKQTTSVTSHPVHYPRCVQIARGAETVVAKPNKQRQ